MYTSIYANPDRSALTEANIRQYAPSMFTVEKTERHSSQYALIPTIDIMHTMQKAGFQPVACGQTWSRNVEGKPFAFHTLRMGAPPSEKSMRKVGDVLPEIVINNSHNGRSGYAMFIGLYRLVCTNGLTLSNGMLDGQATRHIGAETPQLVMQESLRMMERLPGIAATCEAMKAKVLKYEQREQFAAAAAKIVWDSTVRRNVLLEAEKAGGERWIPKVEALKDSPVLPATLLVQRRKEDDTSVWGVYNTVQENIMKGGLNGFAPTGRRITTRSITSSKRDIEINTALWSLAMEAVNA